MSVNVNGISESQAYKIWYNYNFKGNSVGVSDSDYAQLTKKWKSALCKWSELAKDDNQYEITDDKFDSAKEAGKNSAKDATGYDGSKGGMITRGVGDAAGAIAGAVSQKVGEKVLGKAMVKCTSGAVGKGLTSEASACKAANFIVAAPLALSIGTLYMAKKPNEKEKNASNQLRDELLPEGQEQLYETQDNLEEADAIAQEAAEEAEEANEEANANIEEQKTEFDSMKETLYYIESDKASGMTLREDQKEWLKNNLPLMQEKGAEVAELQESATEDVEEKYEALGDLQENFDNAAESSANVQGITEYAEGFDNTAKIMCYVEAGSQGLNAASGAKAAYEAASFAASGSALFGATAWAWAFAAMGAAGAALSGVGVGQQIKWAGEINQEIDVRKETQDMNEETQEIYEEGVDDYEGYMGVVEDLELDIPDDMEVTEEEAAMGTTPDGQPSVQEPNAQNKPAQPVEETIDDDNSKKKKAEKDSE